MSDPGYLSNAKIIYREFDPCQKIMIVPLNGNNYMVWSKSTSLYICRKDKLGYIDGKITIPAISDSNGDVYEINDKTVMLWLLNSMSFEIVEDFLFLDSAKEIRDSAGEIYGKRENLARVYQIQDISYATKSDKVFHLYFSSLKSM